MHILITGGAGFLGRRLAERLLQRGTLKDADGRDQTVRSLTLLDVVPPAPMADSRVTQITGDVSDPAVLDRAIAPSTTSVFHLAAVVSGMAEADFELGMRINVDASRALLEVCRARQTSPRIVFTSSIAVFGGELPAVVPESMAVRPQSSYGAQKAIAELLVRDYTRKGFVDGRVLRLPTISVRPGRPNAAASSFASGIIREPLNGEPAVCPIDPETRLWLLSPAMAIDCLIAGHDASASVLGDNRTLNVPGVSVTPREMIAALARVAGPDVAARVRWEADPKVERIVATWPGALDASRARALGFPTDDSFDTIVKRYIEETRLPRPV